MSGITAGVNASYGSSSTDSSSSTKSTGTSNTATAFDTLLRSLLNSTSTSTTDLPAYARTGMRSDYLEDRASSSAARDFLTSLLGNPYEQSTGGGTGRFAPAINNMFDTQLARARTGNASAAGVARQGFAEGSALAQAQNDLLGIGQSAANSLLVNANPNSVLSLIGAFAPKTTQTSQNQEQTNKGTSNTATNTTGTSNTNGNSNTSSWGVGGGVGCCFIFLEMYNGGLPTFVRRCRDEFTSGHRRAGYNLLAEKLVPRMRTNKWWRRAVNYLMVKPLTQFGGWLYSEPGYQHGWLFAPFLVLWFGIYRQLGKLVAKVSN